MKDTEIKIQQIQELSIDFDAEQLNKIEVISLKRDGKTLIFPLWELWQILERHIETNVTHL